MEIRQLPGGRVVITAIAVLGIGVGVLIAVLALLGRGSQPPPFEEIKLAHTAFASGFAPYTEHASGSANFAADQPEVVTSSDDGDGDGDGDGDVVDDPSLSSGQGAMLLDPAAVAEQERLHSAFIAAVEGWLATSARWDLPEEREENIPSAGQRDAFNEALASFRDVQPAYLDWLVACSERKIPSFVECRTEDPVPFAAWDARLDVLLVAEKALVTRS